MADSSETVGADTASGEEEREKDEIMNHTVDTASGEEKENDEMMSQTASGEEKENDEAMKLDEATGLANNHCSLKKDDSGIGFNESPSKDSYNLSEDSDLNIDDSGHGSTSLATPSDRSSKHSASEDTAQTDSMAGVEGATAAEQDVESDVHNPLRRKRRSQRPLLSDGEDDEADDEPTHSSSTTESSPATSSDEEDAALDKRDVTSRPVTTSRPLIRGLLEKEYGYSVRRSQVLLHEKLSSNLAMIQRLKLQTKLNKHDGCVNALHFNDKGNLLASGSDDLNIVIWDWAYSKPAIVYQSGHRGNVFQAKFMPYSGDCHVISCARDGQVRVAELSTTGVCKNTKKLAQHRGAAHKLALEDSPHYFLSCGEDALIYGIDLRESKPTKLICTKEDDKKVTLYSIHSNPTNPNEFCVGGRDNFIRIYDRRKLNEEGQGPLKKYCPHHLLNSNLKANVTCAVYNYNGTEVLGTYNDEDIYLFDTSHSDGADFTHQYSGHRNNATVKGVNYHGLKSEYIISGSDCGNVFLWEKESEKIVQYFPADEGGVINVLEPHPCGLFLATSGLDSDVKIWAPTASEPVQLDNLHQVRRKNRKERKRERMTDPEDTMMLDGQMLWYLMHHLQRSTRRRSRRRGDRDADENADEDGEVSDDSSASISLSDDDYDDDNDDDDAAGADAANRGVSCQPS
ncbi:DDB1- and CUL4-associated factor 8-like [Tubulanus polymorphus]|uniref:DDB1- and CUL4-associated factor 8-like n=1 Tax=Tubulanus polymorphus TaxID=672921 RepID=UPI003DA629A8